ncbi:MAG: cell wall hydrolase [Bacillota bacterium]
MKMQKFKFTFALLILLFTFLLFNNDSEVGAEEYNLELGSRVLKINSRGADVAQLQKKLLQLSYYNGQVDGLYGPGTAEAVKNFQRDKGLVADGIVGPSTLKYFNENSLLNKTNVKRENLIILARIIHGEARGENFDGKVAVGAVILNRLKSKEFPDNIRDVILQEGQFSSILDGQANTYPNESAINAARAAFIGYDPSYEALYFYNPGIATNLNWISKRPITIKIGEHVFAH